MMKIAVVVNPLIEEAAELARRLLGKLQQHEVLFDERTARALGEKASDISKAEVVITLGGDGTVLRAHSLAQGASFLSINMGDRGFLAEVRKDEAEKALEELLKGKLEVVERMRLRTELRGEKIPEALNDVVIFSAVPGKTATLRVSVDGEEIFSFRGDGLIVSTPTGSSAYTRAAGGPVVFPNVECIVITAICPSSKHVPPLVVSADSRVEVEVGLPGQACLLVVDGIQRATLPHGSKVTVSRSESRAKFFKWRDFCGTLREKVL